MRLADDLVGCAIPSLCLTTFGGVRVTLPRDADAPLVIYMYPGTRGSTVSAAASGIVDAVHHRAFDRVRDELHVRCMKAVGLSSDPASVQYASVCAYRVCHELWSDLELALAHALGLPTFTDGGAERYQRLTLVVSSGSDREGVLPGRGSTTERRPGDLVAEGERALTAAKHTGEKQPGSRAVAGLRLAGVSRGVRLARCWCWRRSSAPSVTSSPLGVPLVVIGQHLGFARAVVTTLGLQVDELTSTGAVRHSSPGGKDVWGLTSVGRSRLMRARRAGKPLARRSLPGIANGATRGAGPRSRSTSCATSYAPR